MQCKLINTQQIKSTIYTIESPLGEFYNVYIIYENGEINGWINQDREGVLTFLLGFNDDEQNAIEMILSNAQDYILRSEKE